MEWKTYDKIQKTYGIILLGNQSEATQWQNPE